MITMLKRLRLQRFKSFEDQEIVLSPLTICVGANASGKSNFFDAIRFLQGIGSGLMIRDIFQGMYRGGREVWTGLRGGTQEAAYKDADNFELMSEWTIGPKKQTSQYWIGCQTEPTPLVTRETLKLRSGGRYIFDTEAGALRGRTGLNGSGGIRVAIKREGKGNSPTKTFPAARSLLAQIGPAEGMHPVVLPVLEEQKKRLETSIFLDITPRRMRDYVSKQADQLGAEGENLSAILWNLFRRKQGTLFDREQSTDKEDIIDWLTELCSQEFTDLDFVETDLGDVMLEVIEEGGQAISARSLSDGTLRFLGLISALRTAPPGSTLLLEEIENGLHPSRVHLLVQHVEEITRVRNIQVIATTHSPRVLDALSQQNLRNAVLFARQKRNGQPAGTVMHRFSDLPHFEQAIEKRSIEDLYISRWLENVVWMS